MRTSAALVVVAFAACAAPAKHATEAGQWIWSTTDSARFAEAARAIPALVPTVWIGTLRAARDGRVTGQLALSPRIAARPRVGAVIRFDDSFTSAWVAQSDTAVATAVGASLRSILDATSATGIVIDEVQLDYDCPERLLRRWSNVVALLARGVLNGRTVWLTSLVAHVRHRDYGNLFRAHVAGHILQVFDTGDRMSVPYARQIERLASRQRMPFRLGVGAFERSLANGRTTDHRAWFEAARMMGGNAWYRGVWVFPGGAPWVQLLASPK